jgi:hypothetical protein
VSTTAEIRDLIQAGETSNVEFKASFRFDYREKKVNRELTKVVAKSIAGFMNSEGGTLLIGVGDNREIMGIEYDIETLSKKTVDGFELALRTGIGNFLGGEKSALIGIIIHSIDGRAVAEIVCSPYPEPVILVDGNKYEFYIRDGNSTRPLNSQEQYNYTKHHWTDENTGSSEKLIEKVVREVLNQQRQGQTPLESQDKNADLDWKHRLFNFFRQSAAGLWSAPKIETDVGIIKHHVEQEALRLQEAQRLDGTQRLEQKKLPPWLTVRTSNVLDAYLHALEMSTGWKRLNIISPWLSLLDASFSLTSDSLAKRLKKDGATLYLVTRPPIDPWHKEAIDTFAATGRANIAVIPDLHAKLFTASTAASSFALVGSSNFTQNSSQNLEIGLLAHSYMEGKQVVAALDREAADIYRTPGRKLIHRAHF